MVIEADAKERLDRFLARSMPDHSRTRLTKLIDADEVLVNGRPEKASFVLEPGMVIELQAPGPTPAHDLDPADIPLEVVYEDDSLLVVNKPRGLAAHPATSLKEPSLVNALLGRSTKLSTGSADFRPGIVHRLDKETTGLMVVAKDDATHVALAKQMETKTAERRYFAVVSGHIESNTFSIDAPIARNKSNRILMAVDPAGKRAVSHVKLVARLVQGSVIAVRLETGRTHQIRVHLSAVLLPVLGDRLYAPKSLADGPLQLHAAYLSFTHPSTEETVSFYAAPDQEFLGADLVSREIIDPF